LKIRRIAEKKVELRQKWPFSRRPGSRPEQSPEKIPLTHARAKPPSTRVSLPVDCSLFVDRMVFSLAADRFFQKKQSK
jgi:hypothetical protein